MVDTGAAGASIGGRGMTRRTARSGSTGAKIVWFVPVLALLTIVILYPAGDLIWISLNQTRYFNAVHFVGLKNYASLFASDHFAATSQASLEFLFGSLALALGGGLVAALALQSMPRRLANPIRTVLLLPWTLSMTVVGCLWLWLFNPSYGLVRYALGIIHIQAGLMLGDPDLALWLVVLTAGWWSFPYAMVLITAALQSVPAELYEAIEMDGGGWRHKFLHVTWRHILPTISNAALALSIAYLTLVSLLVVMTGGGPLNATTTWSFDIYQQTLSSVDISSAAVLSTVILAVNICLGAASTWLTRRSHAAS